MRGQNSKHFLPFHDMFFMNLIRRWETLRAAQNHQAYLRRTAAAKLSIITQPEPHLPLRLPEISHKIIFLSLKPLPTSRVFQYASESQDSLAGSEYDDEQLAR